MNVHPPLGINLGMMSHALLGGGSIPSWVVNPTNPPDLAVDFSNNRAWTKATKAQTTSASLLTVSRASSGTVNDSLGNWTQVASNLPRLSDLGLLVEEARTNAIRNNSMAGAVVMADGVELTTNGNFAAGSTGWNTTITGTGAVDFSTPGVVKITGDGGSLTTYIWQQLNNLIPGRSYVVSVGPSTASILVSVGATQGAQNILGRSQVNGNATNNPTPDRVAFTAPANGTVFVNFERSTASQGSLFPVSVQDGERVENGGFTANPLNALQSTVQNGWQWTNSAGTGTVTWNGSSSVTITGDGTHSANLIASFATVPGFTYTITADITGNSAFVQVGSNAPGAGLLNQGTSVGTGQKFQFTAAAALTFVSFVKTTAAGATIANVSVQSAGALPTNWGIGGDNSSLSISSVGVANGINYVDLTFSGTGAAGFVTMFFDGNPSSSAATYGQTWTSSVFAALTTGSLPAGTTNLDLQIREWFSGSALASHAGPDFSTTITSSLVRQPFSFTLNQPTTNQVGSFLALNYTPGAAMAFTLRIGWPQLENNSINSTVASAATAASGASGVNGSAVYSVGGGTGTAATLNVTWAAGVMTVNSVASAGSYTVFPPSPAALTYVSGTATGWTGATVNLTPTNNAANAFATSPIVTTSSAATRAADNVTLTSPPTFGSAYSMFAQATPQAGNGNNQFLLEFTDGTSANRFAIFRGGNSGGADIVNTTGGSGLSTAGVNWAQNTIGKYAAASQASDQAGSFNGGAVSTLSLGLPVGVNAVDIGNHINTGAWNGFLSQAAIWASQRVPNAQLQSMTT